MIVTAERHFHVELKIDFGSFPRERANSRQTATGPVWPRLVA